MTNPDFRSLCAELVHLVELCPVTSDTDWICRRNELIVRFHNARRAALAQPAPEPTFTDDEVAMLARWLRAHAATWKQIDHNAGLEHSPLAERITRAADLLEQLSALAGEGPTDRQILEIADDSEMDRLEGERNYPDGTVIKEGCWEAWDHQLLSFTRAVLTRYARPAPAPVPVAERLPTEEDCTKWPDGKGIPWCWFGRMIYDDEDIYFQWIQCQPGFGLSYKYTHWLPWWALSLPGEVKWLAKP